MSENPTGEEIQKVRQYECATRGHTYSEIESFGSDGPTHVICSNCGRTWRIVVEDRPGRHNR